MMVLHAIGNSSMAFPVAMRSLRQILNKPIRLHAHQITRKVSFIGPSSQDYPFEGVRMSCSDIYLKEPDLPWGFSIYRCTYKDDKAWNKILPRIQKHVERTIELEFRGEETDLLESHQLVIYDDPEKFDGATSREVRDHFNIWVAEQLPHVVNTPETLQSLVKQCEDKPISGPEYSFGARFNFALFVDDICLESLDHMHDPVVKILYKQWGNLTPGERKYEIHPEWHDGQTDDGEEDVGWMYMSVCEYAETYNRFEWAHLSLWHDFYLRPPHFSPELP